MTTIDSTAGLSVLTDQLRDEIVRAEEVFRSRFWVATRIRVSCRDDVLAHAEGAGEDSFDLIWQKTSSGWGLYVAGEKQEFVSLKSAKLRYRLAAVGHMETLWQACEASMEVVGQEVVAAVSELSAFVRSKS